MIYNLADLLLHVIYLCLYISMTRHIFKGFLSFIFTSAALTNNKTYSFIPLYILNVFTEGFVDLSFSSFFIALYLFASITIHIFLGFLSFISTSAAHTDTKTYSFITLYIMNVFTVGFVDIYFS